MSESDINDVERPLTAADTVEESRVFTQRSDQFKARLERHQQLEKAQEIRDNLLQVARKINAPVKKLAQTLSCYLLLRTSHDSERDRPIATPFDRDTFGHPQALLAAFRQRYAVSQHSVAQHQELALLTLEIERVATALYGHTNDAWQSYTRSLKAQWDVDQKLFSSLSHQEEERKKQQHYKDLSSLFAIRSRGLPKTAQELDEVNDLHEQLCQQREALKLDVPEEVNLFLKAVAGDGATLDMLTENVLSWLAAEDDPTRYRIKRS